MNASPSLTANTREDYVLKCEMLSDVLDVVDCEAKLDDGCESVGGFDLVYDNGFVEIDMNECAYSTRLGSAILRKRAAGGAAERGGAGAGSPTKGAAAAAAGGAATARGDAGGGARDADGGAGAGRPISETKTFSRLSKRGPRKEIDHGYDDDTDDDSAPRDAKPVLKPSSGGGGNAPTLPPTVSKPPETGPAMRPSRPRSAAKRG